MSTPNRIIDKDIESYQGFLEVYQWKLRNCLPRDEPNYMELIKASENVISGLKKLREVIDKEKKMNLKEALETIRQAVVCCCVKLDEIFPGTERGGITSNIAGAIEKEIINQLIKHRLIEED